MGTNFIEESKLLATLLFTIAAGLFVIIGVVTTFKYKQDLKSANDLRSFVTNVLVMLVLSLVGATMFIEIGGEESKLDKAVLEDLGLLGMKPSDKIDLPAYAVTNPNRFLEESKGAARKEQNIMGSTVGASAKLPANLVEALLGEAGAKQSYAQMLKTRADLAERSQKEKSVLELSRLSTLLAANHAATDDALRSFEIAHAKSAAAFDSFADDSSYDILLQYFRLAAGVFVLWIISLMETLRSLGFLLADHIYGEDDEISHEKLSDSQKKKLAEARFLFKGSIFAALLAGLTFLTWVTWNIVSDEYFGRDTDPSHFLFSKAACFSNAGILLFWAIWLIFLFTAFGNIESEWLDRLLRLPNSDSKPEVTLSIPQAITATGSAVSSVAEPEGASRFNAIKVRLTVAKALALQVWPWGKSKGTAALRFLFWLLRTSHGLATNAHFRCAPAAILLMASWHFLSFFQLDFSPMARFEFGFESRNFLAFGWIAAIAIVLDTVVVLIRENKATRTSSTGGIQT